MAVKVTKPEINVREELTKLNYDNTNKYEYEEAWKTVPLAPYFDAIRYFNGGTPQNTGTILQNGGSKIYPNNGNNGPSAYARVKGVAKGEFLISFILGYMWGWSMMYMTDPDNFDPELCFSKSTTPEGLPRLAIRNNNSNNQFQVDFWDGTKSVTHVSTTGKNNQEVKIWRDSSNVIYVYDGSSTYTLGTYDNDLVFSTDQQSPMSVEITGAVSSVYYP